jgi:hypothetical protein
MSLAHTGNLTARLGCGDVLCVASRKIYQAMNDGSAAAKLSAVFVARKGKPMTTQTAAARAPQNLVSS